MYGGVDWVASAMSADERSGLKCVWQRLIPHYGAPLNRCVIPVTALHVSRPAQSAGVGVFGRCGQPRKHL